MQRIIIHWTAGGGRSSSADREHYHKLIEYDGAVVDGTEEIADNMVTSDGDYAAHTRNLNTGSIGVALCGMKGATEYPFQPGDAPLTEKQFRAAAALVADLCRQYAIPVTGRTVLTHAEVEPTLGVKQAGKWDISRIPFRPDIVGAIPVGDYFRELVRDAGGFPATVDRPTIKKGNKAPREDVRRLQADLSSLGYHSGRADGIFGTRTREAVLAFQADNYITTDGVVGPVTWSTLERARPRPRRFHTEQTLLESGSVTIAEAQKGEEALKAAEKTGAGLLSFGAVVEVVNTAGRAEGALEMAQRLVFTYWPVIALAGLAYIVSRYGRAVLKRIMADRVDAATSGRNIGR